MRESHSFGQTRWGYEASLIEVKGACFETAKQDFDLLAVGIGINRLPLGCAKGV